MHVVDQLSNRRFLVDTGAVFSVFPHSSPSRPDGPALAGAAGQPTPCWGEKQFQLSFNGRSFTWTFLLAAVQFPILGVDFLRHFGLLVDPAGDQLVDRLTGQAVHGSPPEAGDCLYMASCLQRASTPLPSSSQPPVISSTLHTGLSSVSPASSATCGGRATASGVPRVKVPSGSRGTPLEASAQAAALPASFSTVSEVLNDFPDEVNVGKTLPVPCHDVQHHIRTSGPPIASRFRRLHLAFTIPRISLVATVNSVRLAKRVKEPLIIMLEGLRYFMDFSIVLGMLRMESGKFNKFMRAWVGEVKVNNNVEKEWVWLVGNCSTVVLGSRLTGSPH